MKPFELLEFFTNVELSDRVEFFSLSLSLSLLLSGFDGGRTCRNLSVICKTNCMMTSRFGQVRAPFRYGDVSVQIGERIEGRARARTHARTCRWRDWWMEGAVSATACKLYIDIEIDKQVN